METINHNQDEMHEGSEDSLKKGDNHARTLQRALFSTGNSARSIMAEAIMNKKGFPTFRAYSAGAMPRGVFIHKRFGN